MAGSCRGGLEHESCGACSCTPRRVRACEAQGVSLRTGRANRQRASSGSWVKLHFYFDVRWRTPLPSAPDKLPLVYEYPMGCALSWHYDLYHLRISLRSESRCIEGWYILARLSWTSYEGASLRGSGRGTIPTGRPRLRSSDRLVKFLAIGASVSRDPFASGRASSWVRACVVGGTYARGSSRHGWSLRQGSRE